jgi:hypothetical protein
MVTWKKADIIKSFSHVRGKKELYEHALRLSEKLIAAFEERTIFWGRGICGIYVFQRN